MATNEVEINVILEGAQEATKELKGLGQAGKSVAESMRTTNEKLGEGFTSVTEGVDDVVNSIGGLSQGFAAVGTRGVAGITSLIGPVALLTTGAVALYQAFQQFTGAAEDAERQAEAMAAAASDLQSKFEALSEKGIALTTEQIKEFTKANTEAQIAKEKLQVQFEKSNNVYQHFAAAQKQVNELQKIISETDITSAESAGKVGAAVNKLADAKLKLTEYEKAYDEILKKTTPAQEDANKKISAANKLYESYEELGEAALQTKAKENIERLKSIRLLEIEVSENQKYTEVKKAELQAEIDLLKLKAKEEDKNKLIALNKELDKNTKAVIQRTGAVDQAALAEVAGMKRVDRARAKTDKEELESLKKKREARQKAAKQREAMERLRERNELTQQARIEALRIQIESEGFNEREQLATLAYNTELQLAEDNAEKKLEAELRYQLALDNINQARVEQSARDAQKIEQDRLKAEAQAAKERDARERQAEAERQKRIEQAKADYQDLMSAVDHYSSGLANAAAGALLFGDSVSQGVADALNALASEAAVNALIETAKGVASAFTNPAESATHFTAAGQFAIAATAARGASALLGGGGGGGVTSGASSSPSGAPQTASAPIREEARESQIVYNINFGSSVIYDSKRAAEQALADRITTIQNTRRRGAPIPRRA